MFAEKIINKVLQEKSLKNYMKFSLTPEYFMEFTEQVEFILAHNNQYHEVPSIEAFLYKFEDFKIEKIEDNWDYLIDNLQADYNYYLLKITSDKINTSEDSNEAIKLITDYSKTIEDKKIRKNSIVDITGQGAVDRCKEYEKRVKLKGLTGVTTGFSELDEVTNGWQRGEELAIILGRTNQGKSWVAEKFMTVAWRNNEIPLLYSGEMSEFIVGSRFDTLNVHVTNTGLMNGEPTLEVDGEKWAPAQYKEYIQKLGDMKRPFYVITPKQLNGKRLDTNMLISLMNTLDPQPTIIGIDQLSLMSDCVSRDRASRPERLENITNGLFSISICFGVPVLADSQAGRGATKTGDDDSTPEIEDAYGSDAIGQNATKVVAIRQTKEGLKLSLKKNRNGVNNKEFVYNWDINKGKFIKLDINKFVKNSNAIKGGKKPTDQESKKKVVDGTDIF